MSTSPNDEDVNAQEKSEPTETAEAADAEEEEPRLKYQRLGSDVTELLGKNAATCLCVSDKILALGTSSGTVHILDYSGNEVCVNDFQGLAKAESSIPHVC